MELPAHPCLLTAAACGQLRGATGLLGGQLTKEPARTTLAHLARCQLLAPAVASRTPHTAAHTCVCCCYPHAGTAAGLLHPAGARALPSWSLQRRVRLQLWVTSSLSSTSPWRECVCSPATDRSPHLKLVPFSYDQLFEVCMYTVLSNTMSQGDFIDVQLLCHLKMHKSYYCGHMWAWAAGQV